MGYKVVANLLIFENEWKLGKNQSELIKLSKEIGFNVVEVRREYFRDIKKEISEVKQAALDNSIELYYSVPDCLFVDGTLNKDMSKYLAECAALGAKKIKLNLGDYSSFTRDISELINLFIEKDIEINIENDQSNKNGSISPILQFLSSVSKKGIDIGFVFDIGNWIFVHEDFIQAAKYFSKYVRYIHLKDVLNTSEGLKVVGLDSGVLPWKSILSYLPNNIPVALEYPAQSEEEIRQDLKKLIL